MSYLPTTNIANISFINSNTTGTLIANVATITTLTVSGNTNFNGTTNVNGEFYVTGSGQSPNSVSANLANNLYAGTGSKWGGVVVGGDVFLNAPTVKSLKANGANTALLLSASGSQFVKVLNDETTLAQFVDNTGGAGASPNYIQIRTNPQGTGPSILTSGGNASMAFTVQGGGNFTFGSGGVGSGVNGQGGGDVQQLTTNYSGISWAGGVNLSQFVTNFDRMAAIGVLNNNNQIVKLGVTHNFGDGDVYQIASGSIGSSINLTNTAGITVGMFLADLTTPGNISTNTYVLSINTNANITVSQATTVAANDNIGFFPTIGIRNGVKTQLIGGNTGNWLTMNHNPQYVATQSTVESHGWEGGYPYQGASSGLCYSFAGVTYLANGAIGWSEPIGMELDISTDIGSNYRNATGIKLVKLTATNIAQTHGWANHDAGLWIGAGSYDPNMYWDMGILFGDTESYWGFNANSGILIAGNLGNGYNTTSPHKTRGGVDFLGISFGNTVTGSSTTANEGFAFRSANTAILNNGTYRIGQGYIIPTPSQLTIDVQGVVGVGNPTISNAGLNYSNNDVLYFRDGIFIAKTVNASGSITSVTPYTGQDGVTRQPTYPSTATPANPVSVTPWFTSNGSNATINITWQQPTAPVLNLGGNAQITLGNTTQINGNVTITGTTTATGNVTITSGLQYANTFQPYLSCNLHNGFTLANGIATKIPFDTVSLDSGKYWDSVNFRYTPQVAGKYMINTQVDAFWQNSSGGANNVYQVFIYKSGQPITISRIAPNSAATFNETLQAFALVPMNGTTDYIETWALLPGANSAIMGLANNTINFIGATQMVITYIGQ